MLRILAMVSGLVGAAGLSQFPEFSQQYLQRLAGKVDQLGSQVIQVDESAAALEMSRDEYLADLALSRSGAQASDKAQGEIALFDRLSPALDRLREASAYERFLRAPQAINLDLAERTWGDYKPALPLTTEGAVFAAVGFFAGWGLWSMIWGILSWPMRRARRRKLRRLEAHHAAAHAEGEVAHDHHDHEHHEEQFSDAVDQPSRDAIPAEVEHFGDATQAVDQPIPELRFAASDGREITLSALMQPTILVTLPFIPEPGEAFPNGWEAVEGGQGGIPLACSVRDCVEDLKSVGVTTVLGLSADDTADVRDLAHLMALPFPILSDPSLELAQALNLPSFVFGGDYHYEPAIYLLGRGLIAATMHPLRDPSRAGLRLVDQLRDRRVGVAS